MSLSNTIKFQSQAFVQALRSWSLPAWVDGLSTRIVLTVMVLGFSVAYVAQTSSMVVSGYTLHELENNIAQLNSDIQKVQTETVSYSSIQSIQQRAKSSDMVAVGKIDHLNPKDLTMAVR